MESEKQTTMIKNTDQTDMVNQIFEVLTKSLCLPLLELVDVLTESFMYPEGFKESPGTLLKNNVKLTREDILIDNSSRLGHPILFELIALRDKITKLQNLSSEAYKAVYYNSSARKRLIDAEAIFNHIYKKLHYKNVMIDRQRIYSQILVNTEETFEEIFEMFETFNSIIEIISQENIKKLTENDKALQQIKAFDDKSRAIYKSTLLNSVAYKDYCLFADLNEEDALVKLEKQINNLTVEDSEFDTFLRDRKTLLHISIRKVF